MSTHLLKHYKIQRDGSLRLVRVEEVGDAPRPKGDPFASLAFRDALDLKRQACVQRDFESLVDAACEGGAR